MPYKSKAQQRFMFAAEADERIPKGTAKRWAHETPNIKKLPDKKKKGRSKKAHLEAAYEFGIAQAMEESGLSKEAGIESMLGRVLGRSSHMWAPAIAGSIAAGPEHRLGGAAAGMGMGILGKRIGLDAMRRAMVNPGELSKAMSAGKLKETGQGYQKLMELGEGSRRYKNISKALGEEASPEFWKSVSSMKSQSPLYSWGGRIGGGLGGGYLAGQLLTPGLGNRLMGYGPSGSTFQTSPAVSDASQHYTGLVPGAGYY